VPLPALGPGTVVLSTDRGRDDAVIPAQLLPNQGVIIEV